MALHRLSRDLAVDVCQESSTRTSTIEQSSPFALYKDTRKYYVIICVMKRLFDHEKLDVYQLELEFLDWTSSLIHDITHSSREHRSELIQQLDRASLSVLLNTARGKRKAQRAKFLDDARGSAMECAACLDASVAKHFVSSERITPGKEMLARIASMLTRLVNWSDAKPSSTRDS